MHAKGHQAQRLGIELGDNLAVDFLAEILAKLFDVRVTLPAVYEDWVVLGKLVCVVVE